MLKHKNTLKKIAADFPTKSTAIGAGTGAVATLLARKLMGGDMSWKDYLLWGALGATGGGVLGALAGGVGSDADQPSIKRETHSAANGSKNQDNKADQSNKSEQPPTASDEAAKLWQLIKAGLWSGTKSSLPTLAEIGTGAAVLGMDGPKKWGIYGVGFNPLNWIDKGSDKVENYLNRITKDERIKAEDAQRDARALKKQYAAYGATKEELKKSVDDHDAKVRELSKKVDDADAAVKKTNADLDDFNKGKTSVDNRVTTDKHQAAVDKATLENVRSPQERAALKSVADKLKAGTPLNNTTDQKVIDDVVDRKRGAILAKANNILTSSAPKGTVGASVTDANGLAKQISNMPKGSTKSELTKLLKELRDVDINVRSNGQVVPAVLLEAIESDNKLEAATRSLTAASDNIKAQKNSLSTAQADAASRQNAAKADLTAAQNDFDVANKRYRLKQLADLERKIKVAEQSADDAVKAVEERRGRERGIESRGYKGKDGKIVTRHRPTAGAQWSRIGIRGGGLVLNHLIHRLARHLLDKI